jgi:hypothetical protein
MWKPLLILTVLLCITPVHYVSGSPPAAGPAPGPVSAHHIRSIGCVDPEIGFSFSPLGLCFGPSGELYVVDGDHTRILRMSERLDTMEVFAYCPGEFDDCQFIDIAADDAGMVYVSEKASGSILTFDRRGDFLSATHAGQGVAGIGIGRAGKICASLSLAGSVRIVDMTGAGDPVECPIPADGANSYPVDCWVDRTGSVFVSETSSGRILVLGSLGDLQGNLSGFEFGGPFGICSYSDTLILVSDSDLGLVTVFGAGKDLVATFGHGVLDMPTFLDARGDGIVCVADAGKMSIEVFRIDTPQSK